MIWLIAEDEADIRTLITTMCMVWGHETVAFENGQKVWDWLDKVEAGTHDGKLPTLVLMDIRMPGKKGNELARRMRTIPSLRAAPIVLMTAFSLSDDERHEMMRADGVDHIIYKPLPDFDQLRSLLDSVIEKKAAAATSPAASSTTNADTSVVQSTLPTESAAAAAESSADSPSAPSTASIAPADPAESSGAS